MKCRGGCFSGNLKPWLAGRFFTWTNVGWSIGCITSMAAPRAGSGFTRKLRAASAKEPALFQFRKTRSWWPRLCLRAVATATWWTPILKKCCSRRCRKFQQHRLRELIGMQIRRFLGMPQTVDQRFRPYRPAYPQSGETDFGEAPQQHRSATLVQLLQRGQRLARVTQLAIGVVFDHRDTRLARRVQ